MAKSGVLILSFTLGVAHVFAQPRMMTGDNMDAGPQFLFFEAVNLVPSDSTMSRLDIPYRIDQNFFIPVRNNDTTLPWLFVSRGEVLIEIFDSLDVSKARAIQSIELGAEQPDREPAVKKWYTNIASFEVPPGLYKIVFEIDDLESSRRFIDDKSRVRLKSFRTGSNETSTPLFVAWDNQGSIPDAVSPVGFGPNLLFATKAAVFIQVPLVSDTVESARIEYSVSSVSNGRRNTRVELAETLAAVPGIPHMSLSVNPKDPSLTYTVERNLPNATGFVIPLASEKLPLRRFDLAMTIRWGGREYTVKKNFQMVWPDMPLSLRNVDYAINALKYITTEEQRDSLRDGDFEQRRDKLEAFWEAKNPKRKTALNETMVEYYRRVDYASKTFGTLREPDGFKSDRGKTYILYGPPTRTERTLSPTEGYKEVWTYDTLRKRFIFADQSKSGNYILISTEQL